MAAESIALDARIFAATPNMAIELGFDQHLRDSRTDCAIRRGAEQALIEFEAFAETFPLGSRERMYITTLRMAAASIASGITRRKRILNGRLSAAEQEQDLFLKGFARGQRLGGFLAGALKLMLLGGFAYAVIRGLTAMVLSTPDPGVGEALSHHPDPQYVSLATALGTTLIGSYIKEFYQGWRLQRSRKRYKAEVKRANDWYQEEVASEYRLAAETANIAWLQLTGSTPPMTRAFECLLAGVLKTCVDESPCDGDMDTSLAKA